MKWFAFAAMVLLLTSCMFEGKRINGNGVVTEQERQIGQIAKIKSLGSLDVIVNEGPSKVRVEAEENLLPYIITEEKNGWLEIRLKNNVRLTSHHSMKVYVTTPSISDVVLSGSGKVESASPFSYNSKMNFKITGSGDISMLADAPAISCKISGSGNLALTGETKDVEVDITGSGNYNGAALKSENADVHITGSGDAFVFADVNLKTKIVGSGDIHYKGNAVVVKKVIGSGSVVQVQ